MCVESLYLQVSTAVNKMREPKKLPCTIKLESDLKSDLGFVRVRLAKRAEAFPLRVHSVLLVKE